MHHVKLMVFGVVLVGVVIFGFAFWDDLKFNQQEIANTPLPPDPILDQSIFVNTAESQLMDSNPPVDSSDDYDSLEKDLNGTDTNIDSDNAELEAELQGI